MGAASQCRSPYGHKRGRNRAVTHRKSSCRRSVEIPTVAGRSQSDNSIRCAYSVNVAEPARRCEICQHLSTRCPVLRKWLEKKRQVKKLEIEQFGAGSVHKTGRFNEENSDVSTTVISSVGESDLPLRRAGSIRSANKPQRP
jgi:hypothetical protein